MQFADIISTHEGGWHQLAAHAGKLLMLDIETPMGQLPSDTLDKVNQLVLDAIRERSETSEAVLELHLRLAPPVCKSAESVGFYRPPPASRKPPPTVSIRLVRPGLSIFLRTLPMWTSTT